MLQKLHLLLTKRISHCAWEQPPFAFHFLSAVLEFSMFITRAHAHIYASLSLSGFSKIVS